MYRDKPLLHARQAAHRPGTLRTLSLDVTSRCNMRCGHCYAETFIAKRTDVPLEALVRAMDEAYRLGVFHYIFQGGEPTADLPRLEAVLRACHPAETYMNVISNGWNLDRGLVRWLRDLQVDKITMSLDSGIEADHDRNRMPGAFRRVMQALDLIRDEGLLAGVSTVATRGSLDSPGFREVYRLALERGIRLDVQIAMPVGKWDGDTAQLVTPEEAERLKRLNRESPRLANGQDMMKRDLWGAGAGGCDSCPAGTDFMAISADGEFLPCNFLQFTLGNIASRGLAEMRAELLDSPWFSQHQGVCICGEDRDFIARYITPYRTLPKPLDAHQVFDLPRPGGQP